MKLKNIVDIVINIIITFCFFALSSLFFVACGNTAPFAQRFTGIVGSFDYAGNLTATLIFPESEQAEGRINFYSAPQLNIQFRYTVSQNGEISFDFDTDDTATGTLHGKDIEVTAHVNGNTLKFSGTFYLLTEKSDGDVTEEGFVVAGHPLSDVVNYPEGTTSISMNGVAMTLDELLSSKMPAQDTTIEFSTQN